MKKIIFLLLVFSALLFISCVSTGKKEVQEEVAGAPEVSETEKEENEVEPEVIPEIEEKEDVYTYDIKTVEADTEYMFLMADFPQFNDSDLVELNRKIKSEIKTDCSNFMRDEEYVFNEYRDLNSTGKSSMSVSFEIYNETKKITSVLFLYGVYENGAAHGMTALKSYNYDAVNKKFLVVTDVLNMSLAEISEICRKQLSLTENHVDDMIKEGTEPVEENFSVFTVKDRIVTIWFEPYQVAPYSSGIQKVEIKY